ncbi:MAG: hypothetical protein ACYC09_02240 [Bacteroidota bacterium]
MNNTQFDFSDAVTAVRQRKYHIAAGLLVLLFLFAGMYSLNTMLLYTPDSARYIAWANSLSHGNGFTDYTSPEASRYVVHAPLYSVLIAPIAYWAPSDIVAMKAVNIFIAAGLSLLMFIMVRKQYDPGTALFAAALFLAHPFVIILSTQILSEILFGFFFILLLYLLSNDAGGLKIDRNFYGILAALIGSVFSREVGLVTIAIVTVYFAYRKQYTKAIIVFFLPVILYSAWYIRNEVYYGTIEEPALRNAALFFGNVLTSENSSLFDEFLRRIALNSRYYAEQIFNFTFSSVYTPGDGAFPTPWMSLVDGTSKMLTAASHFILSFSILFGVISIALAAYGAWRDVRRQEYGILILLFFIAYTLVIVLYPVFDIRFLFPIFLLMILWIVSALYAIVSGRSNVVKAAVYTGMMVCLAPGILWSATFFVTQHKLIDDPRGTFMVTENETEWTRHSQISLPAAAEWLNTHAADSGVILSQYKELAFFLSSHKVITLGSLESVSSFNSAIRDYDIHYIVCLKNKSGWRDYEYQIGLNTEYSFMQMYSDGTAEIYKVLLYDKNIANIGRYAQLFDDMKHNRYASADTFIRNNDPATQKNIHLMYTALLIKHAIGQLDSVRYYKDRMYEKQQGLMFAQLASYHQSILDLIRRYQTTSMTDFQRADHLLAIGIKYWSCDLNTLALGYIRQSRVEDSTFALAYVYDFVVSFQQQDSLSGFRAYNRLKQVFPNAELTLKMDSMVNAINKIKTATTDEIRSEYYEILFNLYQNFGFFEIALDHGQKSLDLTSDRISIQVKMSILYEKRKKYFPAFSILQKINQNSWNTVNIDSLKNVMNNRLYLTKY